MRVFNFKLIAVLFAGIFTTTSNAQLADIVDLPVPLQATANSNCIKPTVTPAGVGFCPSSTFFIPVPSINFNITHREPTALVEVTGKAGRTKIVGLNAVLNPLMNAISKVALSMQTDVTPGTQTNGLTARGSQHYMDAHVYGHSFSSLMETSLGLQPPALIAAKNCQIAACIAFPASPDCHGIGSGIIPGIAENINKNKTKKYANNALQKDLSLVGNTKEYEILEGPPIAQNQGTLPASALGGTDPDFVPLTPRQIINQLPRDRPNGLTGKFIRDGNSQLVLAQSENLLKNMVSMLGNIINISESETERVTAEQQDKLEICRVYSSIRDAGIEVENITEKIIDPEFTMNLYPNGAYLPYGFPDVNDPSKPGIACPITTAGYFPKYENPVIVREMSHCSLQPCQDDGKDGDFAQVTGGRDDDNAGKCWRADRGYYVPEGMSCNKNHLSDVKVEGLTPACNGNYLDYTVNTIQYGRGEFGEHIVDNGIKYDKTKDHRKLLEEKRLSLLRTIIKTVDEKLKENQQKIKSRTGISMQECRNISRNNPPNKPIENAKKRFSLKPFYQQDEAKKIALSLAGFGSNNITEMAALGAKEHERFPLQIRVAQAGAIAGAVGSGQLASMGQMVNSISSAIQMPGQYLMGNLTKAIPFGLRVAFISELPGTAWMIPKLPSFDLKSILGKGLSATGTSGALCNAASLLGIGSGCVRETGYSSHPVKIEASFEVARGALKAAQKMGSIESNKVGPEWFDMDYPYTKASINPLHAGSACYPVGTPGAVWSTAINPAAGTQLKEGYGVFTFWKNTGCFVEFDLTTPFPPIIGGIPFKPCFVKKVF